MCDAPGLSISRPRLSIDLAGSRDLVLHIESGTNVVDESTVEILGDAAGRVLICPVDG